MNKQSQKGLTIIEALVGISILTIMIFGVYGMYNYSLKIVREKGWREQALSVANEEMEFFRSINYDNLGTAATNCVVGPCSLPAVKTVVRNGVEYTVLTDIKQTDDPFDNVGQVPEGDDVTGLNDYKTARVEVRWGHGSSSESVVFVTTFAPVGIEKSCGGGILKINVFDANTQPVSNAGVYITNNNLDPVYINDTKTNEQGFVRIGCLEEDLGNNYKITINKPDTDNYNPAYSTVQTCPMGTGTPDPTCPMESSYNVNPVDPHINIINNKITEKSFQIDLLSVLNVQTITQNIPDEWMVNDTPGDGESQTMPTLAIGPSDNYYFFWQDTRDGSIKIYGQKYNSSKVAQWGTDVQVTNNNDRVLPNVAVNGIGDAYVAWYDQSEGNQEIYIDKLLSADGSSKWGNGKKFVPISTNSSDDQTNPKIDLNMFETFLYLTFLDNSNDANDIYTTRLSATDASQEWVNETKINDDNVGNIQASPFTLVDQYGDPHKNDLYITWHDNRLGDNNIYAQKINYLGQNMEIKISVEADIENPPQPALGALDTTGGWHGFDVLIYEDPNAEISNDSYLFIDDGNGIYDETKDIKISVESDTVADTTSLNGTIIMPITPFSNSPWLCREMTAQGLRYAYFSQGGNICETEGIELPYKTPIIYKDPDATIFNDSYFLVDGTNIKISVENDPTAEYADTTKLNGGISGNTFYLDPSSELNNDSYLFVDTNKNVRYDDWHQNILINQNQNEEQINPAMTILYEESEKFSYFVWADNQNGNYDIYMSKFTNNGARVWENDINITTEDTTSSDQTMPAIISQACCGPIYVAWVDERNGDPDIYMQKFNTSGEKQWVDDLRIEDDLKINNDQTSGSVQEAPQLAINSSDEVVVTWHDNDEETPGTVAFDIKAAIVIDPNPKAKTDVPLKIYGSKTIGKDSTKNNIYKFDSIFITNENGQIKFDGSDEAKIEWDSYTFEIDKNDYSILMINPSNPISFAPNTVNDVVLTVGEEDEECEVDGDLDDDGDVDQDDVYIIKAHLNQPASACPECDIDGDGTITVLDARKVVICCTCQRCICCGNPIDYEGESYDTVLIGEQCWMAESLNVGTMTAGANNQGSDCPSANEIEKYCYSDNEENCNTDGALYQWSQAMCGSTTAGAQGICPTGWHIPTDAELCTLENTADSGSIACDTVGWRGTDAGTNLKSGGSTGFEDLLAGTRVNDGSFYNRSTYAYVCSSLGGGASAWARYLYSDNAKVYRSRSSKLYGFSVRCLKD